MGAPAFFNFIERERPRQRVEKKKIILVEGVDECWMLDHLFTTMKVNPEHIQIIDYGGKDSLKEYVENLVLQDMIVDQEVEAVALFVDADGAHAKANYDAVHALKAAFAVEPGVGQFSPKAKGGGIRLGVFVMPNNKDSGALETLLMETVGNSPVAQDSREFVQKHCIKGKDMDKRSAQVFLSVQKGLCRGAGRGAREGYFDLDSAVLNDLKKFVEEMVAI